MAIDSKTRNTLRYSGKAAIDPDAGPHEAWRAIHTANRIFGADGWNRELVEMRCAATREREGLVTTAYVAKVRVSLTGNANGGVRDAQGCGEGKGATPFEAHNKGLKAAELDATVRALAAFGRPFGTMRLAGNSGNRRQPRKSSRLAGEAGSNADFSEAGDGHKATSADTPTPSSEREESLAASDPPEGRTSSDAHLPSGLDGPNRSGAGFAPMKRPQNRRDTLQGRHSLPSTPAMRAPTYPHPLARVDKRVSPAARKPTSYEPAIFFPHSTRAQASCF